MAKTGNPESPKDSFDFRFLGIFRPPLPLCDAVDLLQVDMDRTKQELSEAREQVLFLFIFVRWFHHVEVEIFYFFYMLFDLLPRILGFLRNVEIRRIFLGSFRCLLPIDSLDYCTKFLIRSTLQRVPRLPPPVFLSPPSCAFSLLCRFFRETSPSAV